MIELGEFSIPNPWILAPMAGVSEMPYRCLALEMGAGAAPTELISCRGLIDGTKRSVNYLRYNPEVERPFWVQVFGGDPEVMAQAAIVAKSNGAEILDINMGCPMKKVTKKISGSALLRDPGLARRLVEAMKRACDLPITVKIRAGWDSRSISFKDISSAVADGGASCITMHARTSEMGYGGRANWDWIKALVEVSPIPVIGNGDIFSADDARRMRKETGCAAVMIGRGALGFPWIFAELTMGKTIPAPRERLRTLLDHLGRHVEFVGDELRAIYRFRKHAMWYSYGLAGAAEHRVRVGQITTLSELHAELEGFYLGTTNDVESRARLPFDPKGALG